MNKRLVLAAGLLAGTIIGAGIFSLPYIVGRLGVWLGLFYLAAFALVYFLVHFMYAELVLEEGPGHNFFHLAGKYFSKSAQTFSGIVILGELAMTLTIYLILAPVFMHLFLGLGGSAAMFLFWAVGSLLIFVKLGWLGRFESLDVFCILAVVFILVGASGFSFGNLPSLPQSVDWSLWLLPFGPLLFALSGRPAVTKMVEEYRKAESEGAGFSLERAVAWGTFVPAVLYAVFALAVLAVNPLVGPDTVTGLGLSPVLAAALGVLGFVAIWTSYSMMGLNLHEILAQDLKWPKRASGLFVVLLPLALYILGFRDFLGTIGVAGGLFLALEGIFIIAMWRRAFAGNKWRRVSILLYLIFLAAIAYQVVNSLYGVFAL